MSEQTPELAAVEEGPAPQEQNISEQVFAILNYANQCKNLVTGMNKGTNSITESIKSNVELLKKIETNIQKCLEKCRRYALKSEQAAQQSIAQSSAYEQKQRDLQDQHIKAMNEQATKLNEARNDVEKKREELQNNLDAANKRAQDIEAKTREGKAATDKEIQDLNNALKNANADFANTTEQLNTLRIQNEEHRRVQATRITELEQQLKKCNSTKLNQNVLNEIQSQYEEFQNLDSLNTQGLEGIIGNIGEEIKKLNELSEQCENCDGNLNVPREGFSISVKQPQGGPDDITQKQKEEKPVKLTTRGGKNKKKGGYKYKKTKKNKLQLKNKLTRRK